MKVKKILIAVWTIMLTGTVPNYVKSFAAELEETKCVERELYVIEPRADKIIWKFKNIGDKRYKRQYNCTTREWIGEWEFVGYV